MVAPTFGRPFSGRQALQASPGGTRDKPIQLSVACLVLNQVRSKAQKLSDHARM